MATGAHTNSAVVFGDFTRDEAGRPIELADPKSIELLFDCDSADQEQEITILRRRNIQCAEGSVEFSHPLILVVRRSDGEYCAEAISLPLSAVGGSKEDAIALLEDLLVASYFHYRDQSPEKLTDSGIELQAALNELVRAAQGPELG